MIHTRTFDKLCREVLDAPFGLLGFSWCGRGVYLRSAADGEDSIALDFRPTRGRFCVMIGYYPKELLRVMKEVYPELTAMARGFACRPYLHAEGTSWEPRWWKCKDRESAARSLHNALGCVQHAGMNWLSALRDRKFYAEHSDPNGKVLSGYAHEMAGNVEVARARYQEKNRVLEEIGNRSGMRNFRPGWREFIYVRAKLGLEDPFTEEIRALANWNPTIQPLPRTLGGNAGC